MSSEQLQEVAIMANRPCVSSPPPRPAPRVKAKIKPGQADSSRNASAGDPSRVREKESVGTGGDSLAEKEAERAASNVAVMPPPSADPTSDAEQVFANRFRARVGSAPEFDSQHRRTRSHFSIPDVTVTTCEEEGKQTHFEVKLENAKRRVTLPTLFNAEDDDNRAAANVTTSHSSGSEKSQPSRSLQGDTREKPKRKQKPPSIRIVHADDEAASQQLDKRAADAAQYPDPPSTAPMTVALPRSPRSSDEAPFSRAGNKIGKRLRKTSLPNLFGRRERDAADAAAMHALPLSPTCAEQGEGHVDYSSGSTKSVGRRGFSRDDLDHAAPTKASGAAHGSNVPTSPTSPSHRPFSPLALLFGSLSNEKLTSQAPGSNALPDRPSSATPTMSKKEMRRREKEEKEMIKELEKVDKMVRKHDKQAEKARKKEESKRKKDDSWSATVAPAIPATPRSPLRRLTLFGNTQTEAREGNGDVTEATPPFASKTVEINKVPLREGAIIEPVSDRVIKSAVPTTVSPAPSSYVPLDTRPPVLPAPKPESHASLDLFDSLYEQVNAMELSFGEHYPVEAKSLRKSQIHPMPTRMLERESGVECAAIELRSSPTVVSGGKAGDRVPHAISDSPSSSSTVNSSRGQLQRESSSTASLHERDSSSNDSIASSKSSALSPTTPSMPFEAGSFKIPAPPSASDTSDETVPGTAFESSSVHGVAKGVVDGSTKSQSVSHPPGAEKSAPLYTKHGKPVRIGVNPRGFRFPPIHPDSMAL